MRHSFISILLLLVCFNTSGSEDASKHKERIPGLLRQLEDTDFDKRAAASAALEQFGEDGVPELEKAIENSKDPEVRSQLKQILATIAATSPTKEQLDWLKVRLWDDNADMRTYAGRRLMVHCHEMVQCVSDLPEEKISELIRLLTSPAVFGVVRDDDRRDALGCIRKVVEHASCGLRKRQMSGEIAEIADTLLTKMFEEKEVSNALVLAQAIIELGSNTLIDAKTSQTVGARILAGLEAKEALTRNKAIIASIAIAHLIQVDDAEKLSNKVAQMFSDPDAGVVQAAANAFIGKLDNSYCSDWSLLDRASARSKHCVIEGLLKLLKDDTISNDYDRMHSISTLIDFSEFLQARQRESGAEIVRQMVEKERAMLDAALQAGKSVSLNRLRDLREYLSKLEQKAK